MAGHDAPEPIRRTNTINTARKASVHALGAFQRGAVDPMSKGVPTSHQHERGAA